MPGDLERSLERSREAIEEIVVPLLDSIASIESLVAAFEDDRLFRVARQMKEPKRPLREAFYVAFGYSPVGTARNMALSYAHLGRRSEGKRRYEECIAELGDPASHMDDKGKAELAEARALFG